jgi:hypothetical protein
MHNRYGFRRRPLKKRKSLLIDWPKDLDSMLIESGWVIVDSHSTAFPPSWQRMCPCEPNMGFDAHAEVRLEHTLIAEYRRKLSVLSQDIREARGCV